MKFILRTHEVEDTNLLNKAQVSHLPTHMQKTCARWGSTLKRIEEIQQLEDDKKKTLFDVIDTFIRESKGRKAFA